MTPTPEVPLTADDLITSGTALITDFGLMPVIMAGAIIGIAMVLLRRAKTGAR